MPIVATVETDEFLSPKDNDKSTHIARAFHHPDSKVQQHCQSPTCTITEEWAMTLGTTNNTKELGLIFTCYKLFFVFCELPDTSSRPMLYAILLEAFLLEAFFSFWKLYIQKFLF